MSQGIDWTGSAGNTGHSRPDPAPLSPSKAQPESVPEPANKQASPLTGTGELLTPDQMAERLGWEDDGEPNHGRSARSRRLVYYLLQREKQLGRRLMRRTGRGKGTRYQLSEPLLRKHCPELWRGSMDETRLQFASHLSAINETIDRRAAAAASKVVREEVNPQLRELWKRDEDLASDLLRLAQTVHRLSNTENSEKQGPAEQSHPITSDNIRTIEGKGSE